MEFEQDKETGFWTLYSPEFNYMAYGKTQEQALEHFSKGLYATIQKRVEMGFVPLPN